MNEPEVTVGFCVKNAEASVKEALSSLLCQDFPRDRLELIVVDGYSRDRTLDVITTLLSETNMKWRIFREKKGLGTARQIVVDQAAGKSTVWLDADMKLTKDFVTKQVKYMERRPKVGIAKGRYGPYGNAGLVATLENMEFMVDTAAHLGEMTLYNALGTSGCIYRASAIRQILGFDESAKGVGEDMDAEYRMKQAGWSLSIHNAALFYETRRESWRALWKEYFWHGRGAHFLYQKNRRMIDFSKMFPPIALLSETARSVLAYRLTAQKTAFLLPLHWSFKRIAWLLGFLHESTTNKHTR